MMHEEHVILNPGLITKEAFNKKALYFIKLDINIISNLVKCYTYGLAETWVLRKLDQKYLESF
jgi:hypothetical protein